MPKSKVSKDVKKFVKKQINAVTELKQNALTWASFAVDNNGGSHLCVNLPATTELQRGTAYNQRIGDKILIMGVDAQIICNIADLQTSTAESVRVVLMYEKQPEGVQFATSELFNNGGASVSFLSSYRASQAHRFKILYDKTFNINNGSARTGAAEPGAKRVIRIKKKWKNGLPVNYYFNSAATNITAIERGALYVLLWTEGANLTAKAQTSITYRDA